MDANGRPALAQHACAAVTSMQSSLGPRAVLHVAAAQLLSVTHPLSLSGGAEL
jgi:hypothetical protein